MRLFGDLLTGRFLARPNRFVVEVELEGGPVEAYLSNPGRLSELLFPEVQLLLEPTPNSKGKLRYKVLGLLRGDHSLLLHTHSANDMAAWLIDRDLAPGLEGWRVKQREVKVGHSRFDLLLEKDGLTRLAEVKSCTLFSQKAALFPDAPSLRAAKHLRELAQLAPPKGPKPVVLFLVQAQGAQVFLPDWHTDLDFARTLLEVKDRLEILPLAVKTDRQLDLKTKTQRLPVRWDLLEREAQDQGSYLFLMELEESLEFPVGGLGQRAFPKGFYLYIGSARQGLTQRLARHQRLKKKHHWHIDYLRAQAKVHAALPLRSQDDLECRLAASLAPKADFLLPGFGASDCHCQTHLFGFLQDPMANREFFDLLFWYRVDRHL